MVLRHTPLLLSRVGFIWTPLIYIPSLAFVGLRNIQGGWLVPDMGIEPIVSALRGQCVKPIPLIRHITSKLKTWWGLCFTTTLTLLNSHKALTTSTYSWSACRRRASSLNASYDTSLYLAYQIGRYHLTRFSLLSFSYIYIISEIFRKVKLSIVSWRHKKSRNHHTEPNWCGDYQAKPPSVNHNFFLSFLFLTYIL